LSSPLLGCSGGGWLAVLGGVGLRSGHSASLGHQKARPHPGDYREWLRQLNFCLIILAFSLCRPWWRTCLPSRLLSAQRRRQRHQFGVCRRHFVRLSAVAITTDARRRNAVLYRDERLRIEPSTVEWLRIGPFAGPVAEVFARDVGLSIGTGQTKRKKSASSFSHQIQSSKCRHIYIQPSNNVRQRR